MSSFIPLVQSTEFDTGYPSPDPLFCDHCGSQLSVEWSQPSSRHFIRYGIAVCCKAHAFFSCPPGVRLRIDRDLAQGIRYSDGSQVRVTVTPALSPMDGTPRPPESAPC